MAPFDSSVRRFLSFWLVLGIAHLLARVALSLLVFRLLDLRFEYYSQLVVVPALQALALCAALPSRQRVSRWAAWTAAFREPLVAVFLAGNVVALALAWVLRGHPWFLPAALGAAEGLAAGILLIVLAVRRRFSAGERAWLLLAGVAAIAYASDFAVGWIAAFPDLVLAGKRRFVRWLIVYPPLFVLAIVLLLKLEGVFRRRWPAPAQVLDAAPAFAVAGGAVVFLSFYWRPYLVEPWSSVVRTVSALAMACLFTSVLLLVRSRPLETSAGPEGLR